jgi:iron complex transport system substrate-binding protein
LLLIALVLVGVMPADAQETECEAGFRLFDHKYLATNPVCIPENPQRIVVAWFNVTALLRANAPLVGTNDIEFTKGQFPEWAEEVGSLTDVGSPINPEVLLELDPDLIITAAFGAQGNEEAFAAIAPTVLFNWDGTHIWQDVAELIFDASGKAEAFAALVAEEEARAAELGELIGNAPETELSIVNIRPERIILYTQYSPGGMIVEDVGFARPEIQLLPVTADEFIADEEAYPEFSAPYLTDISLEELQRADGDYILIFGQFALQENAQTMLDDLMANPLWQTLSAVQNGKVYISNVNFAGGDIGGVHFMLDELANAFGVADELSPNPYITKAEIPMSEAAS